MKEIACVYWSFFIFHKKHVLTCREQKNPGRLFFKQDRGREQKNWSASRVPLCGMCEQLKNLKTENKSKEGEANIGIIV